MTTKAEYYRGVTGEISVSVREARIVVERFLSVAGIPMGAVAPIRDVVVDGEILGLRALEHLDREFGELAAFHAVRWTTEAGGHVTVDAGGMPALVVAPDVLDLAVAAARRTGAAVMDVRDVVEPRFLAALTASAYLYGVQLGVHLPSGESWVSRGRTQEPLHALATPGHTAQAGGTTRVVCTALAPAATEESGERVENVATLRALRDGFMVDAELWWSLWDRANRALAPDSLISRTHAGASVYDDSGQVLGELGEEWDDGYVPTSAGNGHGQASTIARTRQPEEGSSR